MALFGYGNEENAHIFASAFETAAQREIRIANLPLCSVSLSVEFFLLQESLKGACENLFRVKWAKKVGEVDKTFTCTVPGVLVYCR